MQAKINISVIKSSCGYLICSKAAKSNNCFHLFTNKYKTLMSLLKAQGQTVNNYVAIHNTMALVQYRGYII